LCGTHQGGKRSPDDAESRQEDVGLDPSEDHVGGDFADEVRDEEDQDDDGILVRGKIEVFLEAGGLGVAYVGSIEEAEKVENPTAWLQSISRWG
jgi:hypothetical protein